MTSKLNLDPASVLLARELARRAAEPVTRLARTHTTVSVERAVLRLGGLEGADPEGTPWANRLADAVRASVGLEHGVALPVWGAIADGRYPDLRTLAAEAAAGKVCFRLPSARETGRVRELTDRSIAAGLAVIDAQRARRTRMTEDLAEPPAPWAYLIVATGDLGADVARARAAARAGADVIAVMRPDRRILPDQVAEEAAAGEGGDAYPVRAGFRRLRAALDETSRELGRYVRLTGCGPGLCMPEIAALAALERLDMLLSDCLHQIVVRDVNPVRIFIDQRFARALGARAGLTVSPGEETYLATADAVGAAPTVIVSQLLNEYFGREAGLETWQLGIGHAFAIDPAVPDSFLLELAQAQLVRELFPGSPLKYAPPPPRQPRQRPGQPGAGCLPDAFFQLAGLLTGQSMLLVGALGDSALGGTAVDSTAVDSTAVDSTAVDSTAVDSTALENVRYARAAAGRLGLSFAPDSFVTERAQQVLDQAVALLRRISTDGLLNALADGTFAVTRRPPDGGHGLDGVVARAEGYYNPVTSLLEGTDPGAQGDPLAELIGGDR
jgi:beta-lysine 5,6-aminomutase alpha subunit